MMIHVVILLDRSTHTNTHLDTHTKVGLAQRTLISEHFLEIVVKELLICAYRYVIDSSYVFTL